MRGLALVLAAALAIWACASRPTAPAPDRSTAWGYVRLVPRRGVEPGGGGGGYGDRRLRDVRMVDYSRPGFAVVWAEGAPPPDTPQRLEIHGTAEKVWFSPERAVLGAGGVLEIANRTPDAHLLSSPDAGVVQRLAPGEAATLRLAAPGRHDVFLLDGRAAAATLFTAPGAFSLVSASGRFELADLEPGRRTLHVWHPRFPPSHRPVELSAGRVTRVDLEVGVDALHSAEEQP